MAKMAVHMSKVRRNNAFGGTTYSSLCGRLNAASNDGMNITDIPTEVTCKFCLARMEANKRRELSA